MFQHWHWPRRRGQLAHWRLQSQTRIFVKEVEQRIIAHRQRSIVLCKLPCTRMDSMKVVNDAWKRNIISINICVNIMGTSCSFTIIWLATEWVVYFIFAMTSQMNVVMCFVFPFIDTFFWLNYKQRHLGCTVLLSVALLIHLLQPLIRHVLQPSITGFFVSYRNSNKTKNSWTVLLDTMHPDHEHPNEMRYNGVHDNAKRREITCKNKY